jgi:hypothetical protein
MLKIRSLYPRFDYFYNSNSWHESPIYHCNIIRLFHRSIADFTLHLKVSLQVTKKALGI